MLEEREETRAGEERSSRQRKNSQQRERIGRRENRRRAGGFAMTGSKQSYYAKWVAARVVVEMFVQRRRDAEQARREQRDGERARRGKACLTTRIVSLWQANIAGGAFRTRSQIAKPIMGSRFPDSSRRERVQFCSPVCNPARIARRVPSLAFRPRLRLPGNENRPAHPVAGSEMPGGGERDPSVLPASICAR